MTQTPRRQALEFLAAADALKTAAQALYRMDVEGHPLARGNIEVTEIQMYAPWLADHLIFLAAELARDGASEEVYRE